MAAQRVRDIVNDIRSFNDMEEMTRRIGEFFVDFTGIKLTACDFMYARRFTDKENLHRASQLVREQEQGVYVFIVDKTHCLKVGFAGTNSQARWNSNHYNLDNSTTSTLPKSILHDSEKFIAFMSDTSISNEAQKFVDILRGDDTSAIRSWLEEYTSRMEFKFSADEPRFAGTFLESSLHFMLNPLFEGRQHGED